MLKWRKIPSTTLFWPVHIAAFKVLLNDECERVMPKLTLLAKFSITSLALLAAIGMLLGWGLTRHFEQQAIDQQKAGVASLVPPIVGAYISDGILKDGAREFDYQMIESGLSYLGGSGLVAVKIWNRDGMIVYSDERGLVGQHLPANDHVKETLAGSSAAEIMPPDGTMSVDERGYGEVLSVYTPFYLSGQNEPSGVFQGYYDIEDLRGRIEETNRFLWGSILAGFLFLYVSLFTLVGNASRRLSRQSEENAHLYRQAQQRLAEREQAEARTQHQVERLKALRNIDLAITSSLDLYLTLNVILDQVCTQLGVDAADVLILSEHTQELECTAIRGFRSDDALHTHMKIGEGYAGRSALQRRTLRVDRLTNTGDLERSLLLVGEDFVSYFAVPLIAKGQVKGVLEIFHREPLDPDQEWLGFLETLAGQTAIAVDNASLFEGMQQSNIELARAYDDTLEGWSRTLDLRDKETEGHSQRVTEMTVRLARAMDVSDAEMVHVRRGALLHDIGKMGIPDAILHKPGPLTDEEWEIMRLHPTYAYELLSPIAFLGPALDIPYCHHEKWDGTGYPRGLKGEQIPLAARIFAVADVWDALRSNRPYRKARPREMAYAYIREQSGKHFDPEVVEAFLKLDMPDQNTPRLLALPRQQKAG
jgi:HD-GYP domain-containing protein (c-di-GMP phosphodiesterase class II)